MADEGELACAEYKAFEAYVAENLRSQDDTVDYMEELHDDDATVEAGITQLTELLRESKHAVIYTGAGVSTSTGLPDYRGQNGVWTLKAKGEQYQGKMDFTAVRPGPGHIAIADLVRGGVVKYVISTNVDGLHVASGLERGTTLSEVHGNIYVEECRVCGAEFYRDFSVPVAGNSIKNHATYRPCDDCGVIALHDNIVHFGNTYEDVPSMETSYDQAWLQCIKADLVIVVGSSVSVPTACDLPDYATEKGAKLVIVNIQRTPKDGDACLIIHTECDRVLTAVRDALVGEDVGEGVVSETNGDVEGGECAVAPAE